MAARAARRRDHRIQILGFPLHRVGLGVATLAAASAVVGINRIAGRRQQLSQPGEFGAARAMAEGRVDEDNRRPVARAVVGDHGSVFRGGRVNAHVCFLLRSRTTLRRITSIDCTHRSELRVGGNGARGG